LNRYYEQNKENVDEKAEKIQGLYRKHQAKKKLATLKQEAEEKKQTKQDSSSFSTLSQN
jgi:hypothetical protein